MNRYQQIIGERKNKNAGDNNFFMNQEGFYSPTREYKKYKKMEEFQLPDIKKYMLFPLKSDKNKSHIPTESEPTAFQNYKKSQQVSLKRIEDRVINSKNNEFQQIELQSVSNNNQQGIGAAQNTDNLHRSKLNEILSKNNLRLSLQNIIQKQNLCQQSPQQSPKQNESHVGYNIIQSQRFRVSSLEKIRKLPMDGQQLVQPEQDVNNSMNENSHGETNPKVNKSLNSSINGFCNLNKISNKKNMRQASLYHFDSSQNLQNEEQKVFGLSDLYKNLRQSLEQIKQGNQPQILSERNGLRCKVNYSETQGFDIKKTNKITCKDTYSNFSNNFSDVSGTQNILMQAQKHIIDKNMVQAKINASNDTIELIIKSKNPYLQGSTQESNPIIALEKQQNSQNIKDNELIQTEIIENRKNQHRLANQIKSGENSPLFGSTRFLNFLPHHIKRKKIQLNLQMQQNQSRSKVALNNQDQFQEDSKQQYIQTSDTFTQSPLNKMNQENIKGLKIYKQDLKEICNENKQRNPSNINQNINTTTSLIIQQIDDQRQKGLQKSQISSNSKQFNNSSIKESKLYQNKIQFSDKQIQDAQPHSYRDTYDCYQPNTKIGKIKIEEQGNQSANNKNRLTFTQFLPWENAQKLGNKQLKPQTKLIQTNDNSPRDKRGNQLNSERAFDASNYDRKFIDFDINDYFQMKENP